jgi:hypothetical protein
MNRRYAQIMILMVFLAGLAFPLQAFCQEVERTTSLSVEGAYYLPDHKGYDVSSGGLAPISYSPVALIPSFVPPPADPADQGRTLGSSWGPAEIQVLLNHTIRVPFLAGSGSLTSGNNVSFSVTGAISPVSARLEGEATLTPIAFLNVFAGAMAGTGWDIGLFNGMGLNADGSGVPESASLQGAVLKSWIGGTFQFDLAALVPGDWTHVVTLLSPRLQYAWFSGAERGQAWMFEADIGENFNGWKLLGNYFLGYQMPLVLNTVGVLLQTEQNLGYVRDLSPLAVGGWASDFILITISPVLNFKLSERSSLAALVQFRRERLYTANSVFYAYFENRDYVGVYWDFYRIAFSYSLKL